MKSLSARTNINRKRTFNDLLQAVDKNKSGIWIPYENPIRSNFRLRISAEIEHIWKRLKNNVRMAAQGSHVKQCIVFDRLKRKEENYVS